MKRGWWIALLALYFVSLLWLAVGVPAFTSPDENAAYTFAAAWHDTGRLAVAEPLNAVLGGVVHPRSVVAVGEWLVPGSFLGLPVLAGTLGLAVGKAGMLWVTPVLAVLAVLAWRQVVLRVWGDARVATFAAVLLAVHPAWWFYAARTMMHNVAMVAFLVFAAWFLVAQPFTAWGATRTRRLAEFVLAGVCVGFAVFMRASEVLWIGAGIVALGVAFRRALHPTHVLAFLGGGALVAMLLFGLQTDLYRSPLATGYTIEDPAASVVTPTSSLIDDVRAVVLPFGFHEKAILKNVWHFGIARYPAFTVLVLLGLLFAWSEQKGPWRPWLVATFALAAWLGVVYGSWSFNDNPDPSAVTLADSHVRYWLPLFVLATPIAALGLLRITARTAQLLVPVTVVVVLLSWGAVFLGHDGLLNARRELFESGAKRDVVLTVTEDDAVIVVDRADKFLWPHRSVIVPLRSETTYASLPAVVTLAPLYYFGIPFPQTDLDYLNNEKLAGLGLRIDLVTTVHDEALYRITSVN